MTKAGLLACSIAVAMGMANASFADDLKFSPAAPGAPFSSAVQVGDILYLSGQIGTGPDGQLVKEWSAQTRQAMNNIRDVLKAHGLTMDNVFKCTVMLADMNRWSDFNAIYLVYFKPDRLPARSAIGANGLAKGAGSEIECMAHIPAKAN